VDLKTQCLPQVPLTEVQVEDVFATRDQLDRDTLLGVVRRLCLSHERLRLELAGAEILLEKPARKMDIAEARQIVSACIDTKYHLMGMPGYKGAYRSLPNVSLEDMLMANRLVALEGPTPSANGGGMTLHMHIDPRGVAAMYVRERYNHDAKDCLESMGWTLHDSDDDDEDDDE